MKFARLEDPRSRDDEEVAAEAWANSVSKASCERCDRRCNHTGGKLDVDDTSPILKMSNMNYLFYS